MSQIAKIQPTTKAEITLEVLERVRFKQDENGNAYLSKADLVELSDAYAAWFVSDEGKYFAHPAKEETE